MEQSEFFRIADKTYCVTDGEIVPYNYKVFISEYGKEKWLQLPKYKGFTCVPENIAYSRFLGEYVNTYRPLRWNAAPGDWPNIEMFLRHVFSSQYEMGLDYMKSLYCHPCTPIQVLLLVSVERCTGKSTFLQFLKDIFGHNVVIADNKSMHSQFNGVWTDRLLIGIEEALMNRSGDTEFLRKHSTGREVIVNRKGIDQYQIDFFGKFILCSNDMDTPLPIDFEEDRFWVVEVRHIEREDPALRSKMKKEIPAFLHYLTCRQYAHELRHRFLFTREQIQNEALRRIQLGSLDYAEKEIASYLLDMMDTAGKDELRCSAHNIEHWFSSGMLSCDKSDFRRVMRKWGIAMSGASNFVEYYWADGVLYERPMQNTRYYLFHRKKLAQFYDKSKDL